MSRETKTAPDSFLGRWSQRKAAARRGELPAEPDPPAAAPQPPEAPVPNRAEAKSAEAPAAPELPPLESLDETSDYSVFFSEGVSETIKRAALRKLFHTASFNVTDGLDDYDEDFRTFKSLGNVVTREMKRRAAIDEARERAKAEARAAQATPDEAGPEPDSVEVASNEVDGSTLEDQVTVDPSEELTEEPDASDDQRNT